MRQIYPAPWLSLFLSELQEMEMKQRMWPLAFICQLERPSEFHIEITDKSLKAL